VIHLTLSREENITIYNPTLSDTNFEKNDKKLFYKVTESEFALYCQFFPKNKDANTDETIAERHYICNDMQSQSQMSGYRIKDLCEDMAGKK